MKCLLENQFSPITDMAGFIQVPLEEFGEFELTCRRRFNPTHEIDHFEGDLAQGLKRLEPLYVTRLLLISTDSPWTAVFCDDPSTTISYGTRTLERPGLLVSCLEDTIDQKTGKGVPGGVQMFLFAGTPDSSTNDQRILMAIRGDTSWVFENEGNPLPFEKPERYRARRIRDRFTPEMLEEYCLAMGIRLFDESFYGPKCAVIYPAGAKGLEGDPCTYADRQAQIHRAAYGPWPGEG